MSQIDYFLKIDGIDGESTDKTHKGEIEIESWSWGESNSGTFSTGSVKGGPGKVSMQDFSVSVRTNKASPKLMLACASGEHIKMAVLTCRRAGTEQQEYLVITFTELMISSFQTGGSSGDIVPMDMFSMNFSKIEYQYKPQKPDGSLDAPIKTGWNVTTNAKV